MAPCSTIVSSLAQDDSTIFGFDLINEPRHSDASGDTLHNWLAEMAAFVKTIDQHHLLTSGSEGYYGASTPELLSENPSKDASSGTDYVRNSHIPELDFLARRPHQQ